MTTNATVYHGIVHGTTIELAEATGLPDGLEVSVTVQSAEADAERLPPGEGLRRAFGGWAEDAEELDKYLEWNRQQRKKSRPEMEP
jgi:hypothetical protein